MKYTLKKQMQWAWDMTKEHRPALFAYFFLELLAISLSLLFVLWSKRAIDIAVQSSTADLKSILVLVVGSVVLGLLVRAYSSWLNERTRLRMGLKLQRLMIDVQMMSVWEVVKNWHSGDVQVRIQSDCNDVVSMIAFSGISFVLTIIRLLASFGFLWTMDPMLAFMVLAITPLFLLSKFYYRKMRRLSSLVKRQESNFGTILQENLKFKMLIRAMNLLPERKEKIDRSQNIIYGLRNEQLNFSTLTQTGMKLTINMGYLLTFIWGVYRLHTGQITFGTMTAFLQLVGRIQTPILSLFGFAPLFIRFRVAVDRVMELLDSEKEDVVNPHTIPALQTISIKDLSFRYENSLILDALTIDIKRGVPLAVIGSSGRGKTTLLRLLLAILQPEKGSLSLNDTEKAYPLTAAHRVNFGYVPQGNSLFAGTVRENLISTEEPVSEERIRHALWLACAEFVYDLPQGLDTLVSESGHGLSEGQAQRIAIARALVRDCSIWLFDEVTSALDTETATRLLNRIIPEAKNKICIFVTHDLTLAEICTETLYLNR